MKTKIERILASLLTIIAASHCAQAKYIYATLDDPFGLGLTVFNGISGTNLMGYYEDTNSNLHGFLYNGSTWTNLDAPGAKPGFPGGTLPAAMSGNNIVGHFYETDGDIVGFIYNLLSTNWTTLIDPVADPGYGTFPVGISSNLIVGFYMDGSGENHGFIYNLVNNHWTNAVDDPLASTGYGNGTQPIAIAGNYIVGNYFDSQNHGHGFLYNTATTNWTTLDYPLGAQDTYPSGISGTNISGWYIDSQSDTHGFLYNILSRNWTRLDDPKASIGQAFSGGTYGHGISSANIVGCYYDGTGVHGFLATPMPQLAITLSGENIKISWPYPPFALTLQQNADLNTTNWAAAPTNALSNDGTNNFMTTSRTNGNLFFRLMTQ